MMRRRVVRMHLMIHMHVVVVVPSDDGRRARSLTIRTQHGRRHCAPDGKQDGKHDQDDDAKVFHVKRLSGRWSVRAERQKFQVYVPVS